MIKPRFKKSISGYFLGEFAILNLKKICDESGWRVIGENDEYMGDFLTLAEAKEFVTKIVEESK